MRVFMAHNVVYYNDHQALSTARFRRAGSLATRIIHICTKRVLYANLLLPNLQVRQHIKVISFVAQEATLVPYSGRCRPCRQAVFIQKSF